MRYPCTYHEEIIREGKSVQIGEMEKLFFCQRNEKNGPLRSASCIGEPPPPNSGQTLNPDVSAERTRLTLIYWIMRWGRLTTFWQR